MKKALKKEWLEALRSGEYKQTRGKLITPSGKKHCCLGVLCDIGVEGDWVLRHSNMRVLETNYSGFTIYSSGIPDLDVLKELGLTYGMARRLAALNDVSGQSFKQIANVIEEEVEAT